MAMAQSTSDCSSRMCTCTRKQLHGENIRKGTHGHVNAAQVDGDTHIEPCVGMREGLSWQLGDAELKSRRTQMLVFIEEPHQSN